MSEYICSRTVKLVMLGEYLAGKTSISRRFVRDSIATPDDPLGGMRAISPRHLAHHILAPSQR